MSAAAATTLAGKRLTASQAMEVIPPGASVFLEQGACEPLALHRALLQTDRKIQVQLLAAPVNGLNDCQFALPEFASRLNPVVFASTPAVADAIREGAVDYMPLHWSEVINVFRTTHKPDVALLQVSPPDSEGYCNLGANAAIELEVASLAGMIVAEINRNVPVVSGDTALHQSQIDYYVEVDEELRCMPASGWGREEEEIAAHVDRLIPSPSTLQIGLGRVPDAVMARLQHSGKQISIHSGILTDAMLWVAGSSAHSPVAGDVVAGMLIGTSEFYKAVNRHPRISLRSTDYTHSQSVMASIERFISINSAIEVDLLGQVNAECVSGRQVSGVGGQVDFFRGAHGSRGGLSVIAMPSCTPTRSRIVTHLQSGTPVSTSRVDYDFVVTEYGVAAMRNRTIKERAEALIQIAAPQYRQELRQALTRH